MGTDRSFGSVCRQRKKKGSNSDKTLGVPTFICQLERKDSIKKTPSKVPMQVGGILVSQRLLDLSKNH